MRHLFSILFLLVSFSELFAVTVVTLHNGDQYQLEDRLGGGTFGVVYRATSLKDGKTVAIKLFEQREHYDNEANAPSRQIGRSEGGNFLVKQLGKGVVKYITSNEEMAFIPQGVILMEPVEGTLHSASHLFQVGTASGEKAEIEPDSLMRKAERVSRLTHQLLTLWSGLASNRLIHGDIKPENLGYVGSDFELRLLDRGSLAPGPLNNNARNTVYTTSDFKAPEIAKYLQHKLPRGELLSTYADLYSIGKSMLELLCDGCSIEQLACVLLEWKNQLPVGPESSLALSRLAFAFDLVEAGESSAPRDRYVALSTGPLGRLFCFRKSSASGATNHYAYLRPSVRRNLEETERIYLAAAEDRAMTFPGSTSRQTSPPVQHWLMKGKDLCARLLRGLFKGE